MDIILSTKKILDNVRGIWLQETGETSPLPPRGLLTQYLNETTPRVVILWGKHFVPFDNCETYNDLEMAETIRFVMLLSPRKAAGKSQALADTLQSFYVHAILNKVYADSNLVDLASKHQAQMVDASTTIATLVHTKRPPRC